ncbi:hypothetical protein ACFV90_33825 [Streptomyces sp. NPDC059904]|uniref:hypothetical protein n=1 Tax=Streptomyces sp. NPDC059904 TaxID=3346996 RepID=UPI00364B0142
MELPIKMTESFAGAMVTVIPIILVAAGIETQQNFNKLADRMDEIRIALLEEGVEAAEKAARSRGTGFAGMPTVLGVMAVLFLSHVFVEFYLIFWLASTTRPANPGAALTVAITGFLGFALVGGAGVLGPLFRVKKNFSDLFRLAEAVERHVEEAEASNR